MLIGVLGSRYRMRTGAAVIGDVEVGVMSNHVPILSASDIERYSIANAEVGDLQALPRRFNVKVGKFGLAKLLLKETFHYLPRALFRGPRAVKEAVDVITTRPCVYGVFSGPIGGFAPRPELCVGCLRCTIQHPDFVKVLSNPERDSLGDEFVSASHIGAIDQESSNGHVPVKGQGFRGRFGGSGWDGMWTDMSEIVRPTRDGIHGREFISTSIDIGSKPMRLIFDDGRLVGETPDVLELKVPFILDPPLPNTKSDVLEEIWISVAETIDSLALFPKEQLEAHDRWSSVTVPIIEVDDWSDGWRPPESVRMVEIAGTSDALLSLEPVHESLLVGARIPFSGDAALEIRELHAVGWRTFHLVADLHGRTTDDNFILEALTDLHLALVDAGIRDQITLLHSGGLVAAEHVVKAVLCGADGVALDLPLHFATQGRIAGKMATRGSFEVQMPKKLTHTWGVQRLLNLSASWRDQMLELLGAMGLREVRRLRGEHGRRMLQEDLEAESFAGIPGFSGGGK